MRFAVIGLMLLLSAFSTQPNADLGISAIGTLPNVESGVPSFLQIGKRYECDQVKFVVSELADHGWVKVSKIDFAPNGPYFQPGGWVNIASYHICRETLW